MTSHDTMLPPTDAQAPPRADSPDASPGAAPGAPAGLREAVAALLRDWTLEATQPKPEEVEALRAWLAPGGRMLTVFSRGRDPGLEIVRKIWPEENPFVHDRHQIVHALKERLGPHRRDLTFNAYADKRALFRYHMHTLPTEIGDNIGTSTLLAAWNAAIYVAQIEDRRLEEVMADSRYLQATRDVLQKYDSLWFLDESFVVTRRRN